MKKNFLFHWINYRSQEIQRRRHNDEADDFSKRNLLKRFYSLWKQKVSVMHLSSMFYAFTRVESSLSSVKTSNFA